VTPAPNTPASDTGTDTGTDAAETSADASADTEAGAHAGAHADAGPLRTDVCVVGGGPAGLALALALAQQGVRSVVLEHGGSGRRVFRGESVSPDGVWLLHRLGVLEALRDEALVVRRLQIEDGGRTVLSVDFSDFPYAFRHPLEIPQSALLGALRAAAVSASGGGLCEVRERWSATALLRATGPDGRPGPVEGVTALTPAGPREVRARLTVAADGRYSQLREQTGLSARRTPLDRDVLWCRLPFPADWDTATYRVRIRGNRNGLFLPNSGGLVRVGFNIPKGGLRELRAGGIAAFHQRVAELAPELAESVREHVPGWRHTALLDIFTTDVPTWYVPGLALIGDAAHTLSPVLGQGVNHALADAVTLAPLVVGALREAPDGRVRHATSADARTDPYDTALADPLTAALAAYQRAREEPVRRSRALQLRQERVFTFAAPPAVALRRALYRAMDSRPRLRGRLLEPAYFSGQREEVAGRAAAA
jgi:2-polyprenyl-6-methoxyphenol hydroxylase-like FAD-dependent oxidoreductase